MNSRTLLIVILVSLLSSCDTKPSSSAPLTCHDNPKGRSKAEQMAISDACFRSGQFKKSANKQW